MYNRTLHIGLFGLDDEVAKTLQELPAPDRFTFEFTQAESLDVITALNCDITISTIAAWGSAPMIDISAAVHSIDTRFRALVVVATAEEVADWTQKEFNMVEAIWPAPLSVARAIYEFENLVMQAKQQAEEFIVRTYLDALVAAVPDLVWFKTLEGEYVKANEPFCDAVGKISWDVEGQQFADVWDIAPEDSADAIAACGVSTQAAIDAGETVRSTETFKAGGNLHTLDIFKAPIYDEDGTPLGVCAFARDQIA